MTWKHSSRLPQIPHPNMVVVLGSIYSNRTKESHKSTHYLDTLVDNISSTGDSKCFLMVSLVNKCEYIQKKKVKFYT